MRNHSTAVVTRLDIHTASRLLTACRPQTFAILSVPVAQKHAGASHTNASVFEKEHDTDTEYLRPSRSHWINLFVQCDAFCDVVYVVKCQWYLLVGFDNFAFHVISLFIHAVDLLV